MFCWKKIFDLAVLAIVLLSCSNKPNSSVEILERSIAYHDPDNKIFQTSLEWKLIETRPNGRDRVTLFKWDPLSSKFSLSRNDSVSGEIFNDSCVNLSEKITCDRLKILKNYYTYLWYLPINLADESAFIEKKFTILRLDTLKHQPYVYKINIEYPTDYWQFYINVESYKLEAYQFQKKENPDKGELIITSGEMKSDKYRIPKKRDWYELPKMEYLGSDILENIIKNPL